MDLREIGWGLWSGFNLLRVGASTGLLWTRWTFSFWQHGVRMGVRFVTFLTFIQDGAEWWTSYFNHIYPRGRKYEKHLVQDSCLLIAFSVSLYFAFFLMLFSSWQREREAEITESDGIWWNHSSNSCSQNAVGS
jgi:hypothetical protein